MKRTGYVFWVLGGWMLASGYLSSGAPSIGGNLNLGLLFDKVLLTLLGSSFVISGSIFIVAHAIRSAIIDPKSHKVAHKDIRPEPIVSEALNPWKINGRSW
jgi:hypothetical protein